jgi:hypothetical protein
MTMNVNSGKPWYPVDVYDLRQGLERGTAIDAVADFLYRYVSEVRAKALQLGLLRRSGHGDHSAHSARSHAANLRQPYGTNGSRWSKRAGRESA